MCGKSVSFVIIGCMVLTLCVTACGSDGNGSDLTCADICGKVGDCLTPQDEESCLEDCEGLIDIFRASAWESAASCIMDTPCGDDFNPEMCLMQAGANEPDSVLDGIATTLCTKGHECDDQIVIDDCVDEFKSDSDTDMFKAFKDSVHDCVGDCVTDMTCVEIAGDIEAATGACMCDCGIMMACE